MNKITYNKVAKNKYVHNDFNSKFFRENFWAWTKQTIEMNKKPNPLHFIDTVIPINIAATYKFKDWLAFLRNLSKK